MSAPGKGERVELFGDEALAKHIDDGVASENRKRYYGKRCGDLALERI